MNAPTPRPCARSCSPWRSRFASRCPRARGTQTPPAPAAAAAPAAPASVAAAAPAAVGEASTEPTVPKGVTPEAKAVLDRMSTYMRGLSAFSIESRTSRDEVMPSGYKVQRNEQQTLLVERPNHLRSTTIGRLRRSHLRL